MAITFVEEDSANSSSGTVTVNMGSTVAIGDLIVLVVVDRQGGQPSRTFTVADSFNNGSYSVANTDYFSNIQISVFYIKANATTSSAWTVTCTGGGGDNVQCIALHYNGFVYGPMLIASDTSNSTGSSTAVAGTNFNTSYNNELTIASIEVFQGATGLTTPSGWTTRSGTDALEKINATAGTAVALSATLTPTGAWLVSTTSFYDSPAPSNYGWAAWVT